MGYTTDFFGSLKLNKKLDSETHKLLVGLATTRCMKRNIKGYGIEGEFYTLDRDNFGQNKTPDVIDSNRPPKTQPGLWCHWIPTNDGMEIEWDGGEKFYDYVEWLEYLINSVLKPKGYSLTGEITWEGEENGDLGKIVVKNNTVRVKRGVISYK